MEKWNPLISRKGRLHVSLSTQLKNWTTAHRQLIDDMAHHSRVLVVRYEDLLRGHPGVPGEGPGVPRARRAVPGLAAGSHPVERLRDSWAAPSRSPRRPGCRNRSGEPRTPTPKRSVGSATTSPTSAPWLPGTRRSRWPEQSTRGRVSDGTSAWPPAVSTPASRWPMDVDRLVASLVAGRVEVGDELEVRHGAQAPCDGREQARLPAAGHRPSRRHPTRPASPACEGSSREPTDRRRGHGPLP